MRGVYPVTGGLSRFRWRKEKRGRIAVSGIFRRRVAWERSRKAREKEEGKSLILGRGEVAGV